MSIDDEMSSYLPKNFFGLRPRCQLPTTYYLPTYLPVLRPLAEKTFPTTYLPPLFCGLELGSPRKDETLRRASSRATAHLAVESV